MTQFIRMTMLVALVVGGLILYKRELFYQERIDQLQNQYDYLFHAANDRHLLDFCKQSTGISIRFKNDCPNAVE